MKCYSVFLSHDVLTSGVAVYGAGDGWVILTVLPGHFDMSANAVMCGRQGHTCREKLGVSVYGHPDTMYYERLQR